MRARSPCRDHERTDGGASITAQAGDTTPVAGQTFRVRGLFMINGDPADGHHNAFRRFTLTVH